MPKLSIKKCFPNTLSKAIVQPYTANLVVNSLLKCTTSNGCITFCYEGENADPAVIIKVQISNSGADDIVFDIVNGFILNECLRTMQHKQHLTKYLGSGTVFVAFREKMPYKLADSKITNEERLRPFCATNAVLGAKSLADMLHPNITWKEECRIYSMVRHLIKTIVHMGQTFGMTHNDMHTDNILYDPNRRCFVLIDYGRMLFDPFKIENVQTMGLIQKFKRGSKYESYSETVRHLLRRHKCRMIDMYDLEDVWFKQCLYMFDVMALSLGIVFDLKNKFPERLNDMGLYFYYEEHWTTKRTTGQMVLKKLEYCVLDPTSWIQRKVLPTDEFNKTVSGGVFWFGLILKYLHEKNAAKYFVEEKLVGKCKWYSVDMFRLGNRANVMHAFGTVISIPDPEQFCAFASKYKSCWRDVMSQTNVNTDFSASSPR